MPSRLGSGFFSQVKIPLDFSTTSYIPTKEKEEGVGMWNLIV